MFRTAAALAAIIVIASIAPDAYSQVGPETPGPETPAVLETPAGRSPECKVINKKLRLLQTRQHTLTAKKEYYEKRLKFVRDALDGNSRDFRLCQRYYAGMSAEPTLTHESGPAFRAFPDCADVVEIFEDDSINYTGIKAKQKAINDRLRAVIRQQNDMWLKADTGRCLDAPSPKVPEFLPSPPEEQETAGETTYEDEAVYEDVTAGADVYGGAGPVGGAGGAGGAVETDETDETAIPSEVTQPAQPRPYSGSGSLSAAGSPSLLFQSLTVPNDRAVKVITRPLTAGRWYVIEASGAVSDWEGFQDGLDAVWCYAQWRCGEEGEPWNSLRINGRGMTGLNGNELPYAESHVYRIRYRGRGKSLQFHLSDAQWSPGDNTGSITVNIFRSR